jgi:hypothetical protein
VEYKIAKKSHVGKLLRAAFFGIAFVLFLTPYGTIANADPINDRMAAVQQNWRNTANNDWAKKVLWEIGYNEPLYMVLPVHWDSTVLIELERANAFENSAPTNEVFLISQLDDMMRQIASNSDNKLLSFEGNSFYSSGILGYNEKYQQVLSDKYYIVTQSSEPDPRFGNWVLYAPRI